MTSDPGDARRATGESGHGRCAVSTDPATPLAAPVTQPTGTTHLTVAAHEVEAGDLLIDAPYARVATIVTDGIVWTFRDHYGTVIAWWPAGVDVDVVRVEETHQFDCDNLDCPTCTPIANANFVAANESMR